MEDLVKNIITLGAHHRVKKKLDELDAIKEELSKKQKLVEKKRKSVNKKLHKLIITKKQALLSLKKINKITKNLRAGNRNFQAEYLGQEQTLERNLSDINHTISLGECAFNAVKGVGAGVTTALGSWFLVKTYGAASTGTAISSLSGIAAKNATLAWFGGGATSVGGGGMAVGNLVLGGLVVVPALILTGLLSHLSASKKIKEISKVVLEVRKAIDDLSQLQLMVDLVGRRSDELLISLKKARQVFLHEYHKTYIKVYPFFFVSKLIKYIRHKYFNKPYFSDKDLGRIFHLVNVGLELKKMIDQKIIDEEGRPL